MDIKSYKDFIKENNGDSNPESLWTSGTHDSVSESPWVYEGDFTVTKDMVNKGVMIKEKIPDIIKGDFVCEKLRLKTLKNCPVKVHGGFLCNNNRLSSLEFRPKEIKLYLNCSNNHLTSLEFCPEKLNGFFWCGNNKLTSLEFAPKEITGFILAKDQKNNVNLSIEANFIEKGYKDYWPDLLRYCIEENIDINEIKTWPEGFLTDDAIKSVKGVSKFDL